MPNQLADSNIEASLNQREELTFLGIPIGPIQAEILCRIDIPPAEADLNPELALNFAIEQQKLAAQLVGLYQYGSFQVAPNQWKACEFDAIANEGTTFIDTGSPWLEPNYVFNWFLSFTVVRLLLLRLDRIVKNVTSSFLHSRYSLLGLSYIGELAFDIGFVIYSMLMPTNPANPSLQKNTALLWQRMINSLKEDDRPTRMLNAILWFSVNFVGLFVSTQLNKLLNIWGFFLDILIDAYKYCNEKSKHHELLDVVQKNMDRNPANDLLRFTWQQANRTFNKVNFEKKRSVVISTLIFTGMYMVYYCPSPWMQWTGGLFALVFGSIFAGAGRRFYNSKMLPQFTNFRKKTAYHVAVEAIPSQRHPFVLPRSSSFAAHARLSSHVSQRYGARSAISRRVGLRSDSGPALNQSNHTTHHTIPLNNSSSPSPIQLPQSTSTPCFLNSVSDSYDVVRLLSIKRNGIPVPGRSPKKPARTSR